MNTEKYIVLQSREAVSATRGANLTRSGAGVTTFAQPGSDIRLEEADLTKRESHDLRRDPRTRAVA
ncbi:MAG: peptidase S8, partial [Thiothrix litoralis]